MADSFYVPDGDAYVATELTRGPWSADSQHAGPPAALLGREIERLEGPPAQVASLAFDILRPVPIERLHPSARVVRPGRRVELAEADLTTDSGEIVMRARAWRIATTPTSYPPPAGGAPEPPSAGTDHPFFPTAWDVGYHTAMEWRFIRGAFLEPGPALVWMRMRHPLVDGEEPSPLARVLVAADSGNGVSSSVDPSAHLFVNLDLTVHLHRDPAGEWVCLDSVTHPGSGGRGLADTLLLDEHGPIGRSAQSLLVAPRS